MGAPEGWKAMKFKPTVKLNGRHLDPEIRIMLDVARETAPDLTDQTVWITSGNDSTHKKNSKHYSDEAFDIRTRNLMEGRDAAILWVNRMKEKLGPGFDVILEKDHIHVERDVRGK